MAFNPTNPNGSATSANSAPVVIASDQAALPLPTGAATAAKQPALGTAGSASTDVITVQGVASGTALPVSGEVAAAATDSGNPVKVGGKYNSTMPTLTDGQRGNLELTTRGAVKTSLFNTDSNQAIAFVSTNGDAVASTGTAATLSTRGYPFAYNGASFDRLRNNEEATLLASAARTTTQTSADITNYQGVTSLVVVLDMTTVGTGSVTVTIDGKDTASGKYYNLLTGAAIITNSTNRYKVSPTIAAVANSIAQDVLPRVFRIVVTANNANSATYSVGYCLLRG